MDEDKRSKERKGGRQKERILKILNNTYNMTT